MNDKFNYKTNYNNKFNKTTMPPIEVIANCELCVTKNQYIGHVDLLFKYWSKRF